MNTEHEEKIKRWKIAIQHYDFIVQYIKGIDNVEADALSRLVPLEHDAEMHVLVQNDTIEAISKLDPTIYQKIRKAYNALIGHDDVQKTINLLIKK